MGAFAIMMAIVFLYGMFLDWLGIVMIVFRSSPADYGYVRLLTVCGSSQLRLGYVADLLHDAAVRLRTVLHIKALCRRRSKYEVFYRGVIPFILIIIAVVILVTVFRRLYISS